MTATRRERVGKEFNIKIQSTWGPQQCPPLELPEFWILGCGTLGSFFLIWESFTSPTNRDVSVVFGAGLCDCPAVLAGLVQVESKIRGPKCSVPNFGIVPTAGVGLLHVSHIWGCLPTGAGGCRSLVKGGHRVLHAHIW